MGNNILESILEKDAIDFPRDWMHLDDFELKVITMVAILSKDNQEYDGTLKDMCDWLGLNSCTTNNRKIRGAIESLCQKEYLSYNISGRKFKITINKNDDSFNDNIKIKRDWIYSFKSYNKDSDNKRIDQNFSVDWSKILKVFAYLYSSRKQVTITTTMKTIGENLNMHKNTVSKAIKAIENCDLKGLIFSKHIEKETIEIENSTFTYCIGTNISFGVKFNGE